jgi:hypothetical protein
MFQVKFVAHVGQSGLTCNQWFQPLAGKQSALKRAVQANLLQQLSDSRQALKRL